MELTKAQIRYVLGIRALSRESAPCMAELAKHMGVSKPSAHRMLDQLEAKGVVRRDAKKRFRFTDEGAGVAEALCEKRRDIEEALARTVAPDPLLATRCAVAVLCEMMAAT